MPVHRDNLKNIVDAAWDTALESPARDNKERSAQWVDALARQFEKNYRLERRHRVFWRGREEKVQHFRVKELLFDITVCSVSTTLSLQNPPKPLEFISDCHWQVESEFAANDLRAVVVDMSKLVLGSAENQMIVAAHRNNDESRQKVLAQCADIAACCRTNVFFLFVAHPKDWLNDPPSPLLFEWIAGDWWPIDPKSG